MARLRALAALAALGAAATGCGPEVLEPRDPTPGAVHFKVATYNVLSERAHDAATIAAVGASGAAIVCLQEVTAEWGEVLRQTYSDVYPYMLYRERIGASGMAVLSRYPLTGSEMYFVRNWHPAWQVSAQTDAGWLQLLLVHLRAHLVGRDDVVESYVNVGEDHLLQTRAYIERTIEDVPTVILGDFNEGPSGSSLEYLESLGYRNALPLYRPGQFTWRHPSLGDQANAAIDHILFNPYLEPLNAYVLVEGNSDHLPVVAHFEASAPWPALDLTPQVSEALTAEPAEPAQN